MKIYVNDNPNVGSCNVAAHFSDNWNTDTLHPDVAALPVEINTNALVDTIVVDGPGGKIAFVLKDHEALRLDVLQQKILELL